MMQTAMEFDSHTPTAALPMNEIEWRIGQAIRDGRIEDEDMRGKMLGFLGALKRRREDCTKPGPSPKQEGLARALVADMRRYTRAENEDLIDRGDSEAGRETAKNYEEF